MAEQSRHRRVSASQYVYGNAVPNNVQVLSDPRKDPMRQANERAREQRRRNRVKAERMNFVYVSFLVLAAVAMIAMCYQFLTLQTAMNKKVSAISQKEVQLADLKAENDFNLTRVEESVDLNYIRQVAMERLGMVEPTESQIITYAYDDSDYVRQYSGVPSSDDTSILDYFDE
ncbi:MAG: hypothetical protein ACLU61_06300 [Lachnospiraceae bacterium]|mgnify:CR=1 FL=1